MFPPFPPLPPSGPPNGTYFSLKKDVHPSPPLPAINFKLTSSINIKIPLPYNFTIIKGIFLYLFKS